tara:strand:- start:277 stop:600 length:324 start_codon:yes stop_codon:yes gene_type:complete
MADSKETIKASMTAPTHRVVDGVKVDLTAEEAEAILDEWVDNEHARQVDEDANGYKTNRANAYPQIAEQLDKLFHDIDGGLLGEDAKTGSLYLALKEVKDDNPKPSE